jgi:mono/diheme cytochrome c family protein
MLIFLLLGGCRLRQQAGSADAGSSLPAPEADPDSGVGRGYASVVARGCAQCHEPDDPTDGVLAGQTTPVPGTNDYGSNLTPDPDTGLDGWTPRDVTLAVRSGMALDGGTLCPSMTRYPDVSDDEGADVAAYLQSLVPVRRAIPASGCSR